MLDFFSIVLSNAIKSFAIVFLNARKHHTVFNFKKHVNVTVSNVKLFKNSTFFDAADSRSSTLFSAESYEFSFSASLNVFKRLAFVKVIDITNEALIDASLNLKKRVI